MKLSDQTKRDLASNLETLAQRLYELRFQTDSVEHRAVKKLHDQTASVLGVS